MSNSRTSTTDSGSYADSIWVPTPSDLQYQSQGTPFEFDLNEISFPTPGFSSSSPYPAPDPVEPRRSDSAATSLPSMPGDHQGASSVEHGNPESELSRIEGELQELFGKYHEAKVKAAGVEYRAALARLQTFRRATQGRSTTLHGQAFQLANPVPNLHISYDDGLPIDPTLIEEDHALTRPSHDPSATLPGQSFQLANLAPSLDISYDDDLQLPGLFVDSPQQLDTVADMGEELNQSTQQGMDSEYGTCISGLDCKTDTCEEHRDLLPVTREAKGLVWRAFESRETCDHPHHTNGETHRLAFGESIYTQFERRVVSKECWEHSVPLAYAQIFTPGAKLPFEQDSNKQDWVYLRGTSARSERRAPVCFRSKDVLSYEGEMPGPENDVIWVSKVGDLQYVMSRAMMARESGVDDESDVREALAKWESTEKTVRTYEIPRRNDRIRTKARSRVGPGRPLTPVGQRGVEDTVDQLDE